MSWICANLRERVQVLIPEQNPNDNGSLDLEFGQPMGDSFEFGQFDKLAPVKTIWAGLKPISFQGRGAQYVRGEQINENVTHAFKIRKSSLDDLGKEFGLGFSSAFKYMADLIGLKSNYFLFVERGSSSKGRLFRVHDVVDHREDREYYNIGAEEIETKGDGYGI